MLLVPIVIAKHDLQNSTCTVTPQLCIPNKLQIQLKERGRLSDAYIAHYYFKYPQSMLFDISFSWIWHILTNMTTFIFILESQIVVMFVMLIL